MSKDSDEILLQWAAAMAEHQRNADMARDPRVRKAYLDLVDGYRRLIESEMTAQRLFVALSERKNAP